MGNCRLYSFRIKSWDTVLADVQAGIDRVNG